VALGLLVLAPLAGATLAALVVPHQATAQGDALTEASGPAWTDARLGSDEPRTAALSPADRLRQQAEAEVLRLTRLLRDVREEQAGARATSHPSWEAALSALIAGRAGHATVSGAVRRAEAEPHPEHLAAWTRDAQAAADHVRRGHALLAVARRQAGQPSPGREGMTMATPVLTGPVDPLDPAVPAAPSAIASTARSVDAVAMVPEPSVPFPARPNTLEATAQNGAGLVGPLMDRPSVMVTGPLALPPPGVAPFHRGGPADWEPALTPLARPLTDPAVVVNPAFAGPMPAYDALRPVMGTTAPATAVAHGGPGQRDSVSLRSSPTGPDSPPPNAAPVSAPVPMPLASSGPQAPPVPRVLAPTPPASRPSIPLRETRVARAEPPGAPPPTAGVSAPVPLGTRGHATRPVPFAVSPDAPAAGPDAPPDRQFADIAAQVAVEHDKAARILQLVGPVRADLTRRMEALPSGDERRAALGAVMETVNQAETSLRVAVDQYGALRRQLDWALSMLESGRATGSQWSPRDASRQAIAASVQARQGVTGLKLAMGQFEQVMGLGSGGMRIGE